MNKRMRAFQSTIQMLLILIAVAVALFLYGNWQQSQLNSDQFSTGYFLIGCLFFLAAYQWRKKIPFLPMFGSSKVWLNIHITVGFSTFLLFAFHIGFKMPNGMLESTLAGLYLLVAGSGVYGLFASRTIPRKLTHLNDEVIFEQIPLRRRELIRQVRSIMQRTMSSNETLARFYVNRLAPFFESSRPLAYHVCPTSRHCRRLQGEIQQLDRYLAHHHRELGRQLINLVQSKDNLDYHRTMQGRLKYWLFLHIGLTYSLLLVSFVHGVMAHAFHGGIQ